MDIGRGYMGENPSSTRLSRGWGWAGDIMDGGRGTEQWGIYREYMGLYGNYV